MSSPRKSKQEHVISINSKVVRDFNRSVVLNFIRERQPISRARIAQLTNLNKSTVSSIVASLFDEELIDEEIEKGRNVGRTPINLRLKTGRHLVGAIHFDSIGTKIAIVDIDGTIKQSAEIKTEAVRPEEFIAHALEELASLRKRHHLPHFQGLGVTVAGIVDSVQSRVSFAPNLGWEEVDIGKIIRDLCPDVGMITVENDAKASALAELWFGKHDINLSNFVFVSVGRGIGTGIVMDKRIINGDSHAAGEYGHTTLFEGGTPCSCGNEGCWEAYASDRATVRRYVKEKYLDTEAASMVTIEDVINGALQSETVAREVLVRTGQYSGMGIANIIKSIDPEAIIIGGPITRAWDIIVPEITAALTRRAFFGKSRYKAILPSSLTAPAQLLGAAALPIRRVFSGFRIAM